MINKNRFVAKKRTKLIKNMINAANKIKFFKLKLDNNKRALRLKFMIFIEDLTVLFAKFSATSKYYYTTQNSPHLTSNMSGLQSHFSPC